MASTYDLIIIGSGLAGLTAGLFAGRAKLKTAILESEAFGGSIINAELVENFPGFPNGVSGATLVANLMKQVMQYGVELKRTKTIGIELRNGLKWVNTIEAGYFAKAVIIAGGARSKKLGIPGEEKYKGNGVFYCAMCDGNRFSNREVAIIGGGDGGVSEGLYMTRIASKVTVIEILPNLSATPVLQEKVKANSKMEILCSTVVEAITDAGSETKCLHLKDVERGKGQILKYPVFSLSLGWILRPSTLRGQWIWII